MKRIQGKIRGYAWGSPSAIPRYFGLPEAAGPIAEVWLGAHRDDPAVVDPPSMSPLCDVTALGQSAESMREAEGRLLSDLRRYIASDPERILGREVARQGAQLPYLLKVIAASEPLSLQVHPSLAQAREGFEAEERAGVDRASPNRLYRDSNHKPELVYALTNFFGLAGFRTPRRVASVVRGLDHPLTQRLAAIATVQGVKAAFAFLLEDATRPSEGDIAGVVEAVRRRLGEESNSLRADSTLIRLAQKYPKDPGVVASLLLNPVSLRAGEALFIPSRTIHAYMEGLAVELMASSDNVLRAGLTPKHVDVPELLRVVSEEAAPPVRIAPERVSANAGTFYVPVDDFALTVVRPKDANEWVSVPEHDGPRTLICLDGAVQVEALGCPQGGRMSVDRGQAVFFDDSDGEVRLRGFGHIVVASVP